MGRTPMPFDQEAADKLCELIAHSDKGIYHICEKNPELPSVSTFMRWLDNEEHLDFRKQYAHAREKQADFLCHQIVDISDNSSEDIIITDDGKKLFNGEFAARSRLRVDARKWVASKLAPKKYGDKTDITSGGEPLNIIVGLPKPDADHTD